MGQRARKKTVRGGGTEGASTAGSFRDPHGFVFEREGRLLRQVNAAHRDEHDLLMGSGLYEALVEAGLLIPHREEDLALAATPEAYRVLEPERVAFISYPYEWSFGMLRDAALATLRIQELALGFGMSLRDASAYNVQFHRGRPVLIDTLSFERLREGRPWVAYRQFCQHFLGPLALMSHRDVRLGQLLRLHIDGVPLDLVASLLPRRTRLRPGLMLHVHLHARSQRRHAKAATPRGSFGPRAFLGLVQSLRSAVDGLRWEPACSAWVGYYQEAESYTSAALEHKKELVARFVEEAAPEHVWDLGGNVGAFSRIASDRGIFTVCLDVDPGCVEANYRQVVAARDTNLLPLVMDLANPSSRIGWENRERMSLADRGPADLVLALALVHHLAIGNNVPLRRLGGYLAELGRALVVEFVPKSDPRVRDLLAVRDDIFGDYTAEGFERAFGERFEILRREPVRESERVLYLMRRTG
ncbi:MAG TPA: SAM-dependent methyltransferase [Actinomycetota bacterium]|nr:SAM-dependent methyltransferase [Actinomycetota bacterium]